MGGKEWSLEGWTCFRFSSTSRSVSFGELKCGIGLGIGNGRDCFGGNGVRT